ncbi:hypothetical protein [Thalassoglobus neptunius]|nr:hypothetical protein [Thalassoglobus neptunius]
MKQIHQFLGKLQEATTVVQIFDVPLPEGETNGYLQVVSECQQELYKLGSVVREVNLKLIRDNKEAIRRAIRHVSHQPNVTKLTGRAGSETIDRVNKEVQQEAIREKLQSLGEVEQRSIRETTESIEEFGSELATLREEAQQIRSKAGKLAECVEELEAPQAFQEVVDELSREFRELQFGMDDIVGNDVAQEVLGLSSESVKKLAMDGRIGKKVSGRYVFSLTELNEFSQIERPSGIHKKNHGKT